MQFMQVIPTMEVIYLIVKCQILFFFYESRIAHVCLLVKKIIQLVFLDLQ